MKIGGGQLVWGVAFVLLTSALPLRAQESLTTVKEQQRFAEVIKFLKQDDCKAAEKQIRRWHDLLVIDRLYYRLAQCWKDRKEWKAATAAAAQAFERMPTESQAFAGLRLLYAYLLARMEDRQALQGLWSALPSPESLELASDVEQLFEVYRFLSSDFSQEEWLKRSKGLYLAMLAKVPRPAVEGILKGREPQTLWSEPLFLREWGSASFQGKQYKQASTLYERYYSLTQDASVLPRLGRTQKLLGDKGAEERTLKQQVSLSSDAYDKRQAMLNLGRFLWNAGRDVEANDVFKAMFANRNRAHQEVIYAAYMSGRLLETQSDFLQAEKSYRQVLRFDAQDEFHQRKQLESVMRLAWIAMRQGKRELAMQWLQKTLDLDRYGLVSDEVRFWIGEWRRGVRQSNGAEQSFLAVAADAPYSYYGLMARKRLPLEKRPALRPIAVAAIGSDNSDRLESRSSSFTTAPFSSGELLQIKRFDVLVELGDRDMAAQELMGISLTGRDESQLLALTKRFYDAGDTYNTLRLAKFGVKYDERKVTVAWLSYLYPKPPFWEEVRRYSMRNGVDPYLVLALMRQESEFRDRVVSSADAYGVMQILPSLTKSLSPHLAMDFNDPRQLFEPTFNIRVGTFHLGQLLKRYRGNLIFTFAAYNGSERAVSRWRDRHPEVSEAEFIEEITYGETKHYVKQLLRNYFMYAYLGTGLENGNILP